MQPFGQGFIDISPAENRLKQYVAGRQLCNGGHQIYNMCATVATIQIDPGDNRKLHKG